MLNEPQEVTHPMTRQNYLYLAAGERNIRDGKVKFANVGMSHDPEKRLKDPDYRLKAGGGKWVLLGPCKLGRRYGILRMWQRLTLTEFRQSTQLMIVANRRKTVENE